jgi:hypothetical protein
MANRIVNFQMQQPGEMANPQVVGVQQQNRLSLAERLRKYGLDQDSSGPQSFADSFNQQMYGRRPQDEATQAATPESNQSRLDKYYSSPDASAGYTPDGGAQQRQPIMNRYNAKGGGSQTGYSLTSGQKPAGMFAGAGNAISRGASNAGSAISKGFGSAAAGFGKLFA